MTSNPRDLSEYFSFNSIKWHEDRTLKTNSVQFHHWTTGCVIRNWCESSAWFHSYGLPAIITDCYVFGKHIFNYISHWFCHEERLKGKIISNVLKHICFYTKQACHHLTVWKQSILYIYTDLSTLNTKNTILLIGKLLLKCKKVTNKRSKVAHLYGKHLHISDKYGP